MSKLWLFTTRFLCDKGECLKVNVYKGNLVFCMQTYLLSLKCCQNGHSQAQTSHVAQLWATQPGRCW